MLFSGDSQLPSGSAVTPWPGPLSLVTAGHAAGRGSNMAITVTAAHCFLVVEAEVCQ